jgi:hypothetical protein
MKAVAFATVISTAVAGGSLSLSFKDCGAKHAVTEDVQPTSLELGADTAITGTGKLDKAVSGGTYDMELKAGGGLIDSHFKGNNCEAKDFTLPLGLGTLSWDGINCPLAAADSVSIGFHTKLASSLPAALATSDIHLGANDQDGESVLCVDLHLAKQKTVAMHEDVGMGGQVFMEGFLQGFLGDAKYIKACVSESVEVAQDIKHLVADVRSRNLNKTISHFQALVTDAMADVQACKAIGKDLAPFLAAFKGVHSIKGLVKKLENNFLAHDEEILDLLEDMLDVCTFGAPDGHKCGVDAGKQMRSLVIGDRLVSTLQEVIEGHKSAFADFLDGFTGNAKLSECIGKDHEWDECKDVDKDDKEVAAFMAGLTDVHGVKDIVHAIMNALKQHFLDHDGEILDLLGDMTKVCTFAAPDGHKCAGDLGKIVRSILFGSSGNTVVV